MSVPTTGPGASGMIPFDEEGPEPMRWTKNEVVIQVSAEMADEIRSSQVIHDHLQQSMWRSFDRLQNPWKYPDPPAFSRFYWDPFPRWTRFRDGLDHLRPSILRERLAWWIMPYNEYDRDW